MKSRMDMASILMPQPESSFKLEPKQKNFSRGLIFWSSRCLPSEGINIFSSGLIFSLSRDLPLEGEKSARDMEKDFFGRTLKMPLSHSSHYEDMYLDN